MLEGSHGMARDADAAVALLEEKVKDRDAEAMWMLGVCCEYGTGMEQDVDRALKLYQRGAKQGNTAAKLLTDKLKNKNGQDCTEMVLECEPDNQHKTRSETATCVTTTVAAVNSSTMR